MTARRFAPLRPNRCVSRLGRTTRRGPCRASRDDHRLTILGSCANCFAKLSSLVAGIRSFQSGDERTWPGMMTEQESAALRKQEAARGVWGQVQPPAAGEQLAMEKRQSGRHRVAAIIQHGPG